MTASVPFSNKPMIVECLVVTVLVEDVNGGGVAWCVFVSLCVQPKTGLCWKQRTASPLLLSQFTSGSVNILEVNSQEQIHIPAQKVLCTYRPRSR